MPKTRKTAGKPTTRKVGKPFTASKDRAARTAKPATVSPDQAEREADAIVAGAERDAAPHRVLTAVARKGRQAKPTTAEPTAALPETNADAPQALVVDVSAAECTTLANRVAALLGREVRIMDTLTGRLLTTVAAPERKASVGGGKARSVIVDAGSRPEGATSAELFTATGWKFASWSHQLKIAATATGLVSAIRKVDGTTRYFLTQPATTEAADAPAPEVPADETATTDATGEVEREREAT
jgi:hypothetical protein